jgi:hypothetical protein
MFGDSRLPERFWAKIAVDEGSGCWLWKACTDRYGYGQFRVGSRTDGSSRMARAHRVVYETLVGEILKGLQADHLCRVRRCVNPTHLEPVTQRENILRGEAAAARNAAKTHCVRGHEFSEENTYWRPDGGRECRACKRRWAREQANRTHKQTLEPRNEIK